MNKVCLFLTLFFTLSSVCAKSSANDLNAINGRNCYSVAMYFENIINPLFGTEDFTTDKFKSLSNGGNRKLYKALKYNFGKNTQQFEQRYKKFVRASEKDTQYHLKDDPFNAFFNLKEGCEDLMTDLENEKKMGKPHSSHSRGTFTVSKPFSKLGLQNSKLSSDGDGKILLGYYSEHLRAVCEREVIPGERYKLENNCGPRRYQFIASDNTAKQICKQFAKRSYFEIGRTDINTDAEWGIKAFSYEGGNEWVLRHYKNQVILISAMSCY
jgi:hypothetical protein